MAWHHLLWLGTTWYILICSMQPYKRKTRPSCIWNRFLAQKIRKIESSINPLKSHHYLMRSTSKIESLEVCKAWWVRLNNCLITSSNLRSERNEKVQRITSCKSTFDLTRPGKNLWHLNLFSLFGSLVQHVWRPLIYSKRANQTEAIQTY
jgi:hypothetical protein